MNTAEITRTFYGHGTLLLLAMENHIDDHSGRIKSARMECGEGWATLTLEVVR